MVHKLQNLRELQTTSISDLPQSQVRIFQMNLTEKDASVDVGLLARILIPQEQVFEADEEWVFESLFVTVTNELQQEEMSQSEENIDVPTAVPN